MLIEMAWRMWRLHDARLLGRMGLMGLHNLQAMRAFEQRRRKGRHFPPFVFISVTDACNLRCQGCWVSQCSPPRSLSAPTLDRLIQACKGQGCRFFGILGGEPLLHADLWAILARHQDCYFQLFTNGLLLDEAVARRLRHLGNVTPLLSIEGLDQVADVRRGGRGVFRRTVAGLEAARAQRLVTGVATSVCASNFAEVVSPAFVKAVMARGVAYLWYYIYRPVGPRPHPELCLSRDQILALRRFIVEMRRRVPLIIVDAYWDAEGRALCPAAVGISHHISPDGAIEPCPVVQFADRDIGDGAAVVSAIADSDLLARFRTEVPKHTRGCVLLEDRPCLEAVVSASGAHDSSGRDVGLAEVRAVEPQAGHDLAGDAVPEQQWLYRLAKRRWFFGFGAYG